MTTHRCHLEMGTLPYKRSCVLMHRAHTIQPLARRHVSPRKDLGDGLRQGRLLRDHQHSPHCGLPRHELTDGAAVRFPRAHSTQLKGENLFSAWRERERENTGACCAAASATNNHAAHEHSARTRGSAGQPAASRRETAPAGGPENSLNLGSDGP